MDSRRDLPNPLLRLSSWCLHHRDWQSTRELQGLVLRFSVHFSRLQSSNHNSDGRVARFYLPIQFSASLDSMLSAITMSSCRVDLGLRPYKQAAFKPLISSHRYLQGKLCTRLPIPQNFVALLCPPVILFTHFSRYHQHQRLHAPINDLSSSSLRVCNPERII